MNRGYVPLPTERDMLSAPSLYGRGQLSFTIEKSSRSTMTSWPDSRRTEATSRQVQRRQAIGTGVASIAFPGGTNENGVLSQRKKSGRPYFPSLRQSAKCLKRELTGSSLGGLVGLM